MDIDRLVPYPDTRPAAGDIGDLLGRLRAAGSVEAEVIRVLRDQLLLRSELGEILARNRLDLRPGDRVRIRLAGTPSEPVLRVSPAPPKPITVAADSVPRLAGALPVDRPVLAEILRVLPAATEIRWAGRTHYLPVRIESVGRSLLSLERRPSTASIVLTPLARAPIYRALLRQLLPRQTPDDAASLVRLAERAQPRAPAPARAAQGSPVARATQPQLRSATERAAATQPLRALRESFASRAPVVDRPAPPVARAPATSTGVTASRSLPRSPRLATARDPAVAGAARGDDRPVAARDAVPGTPNRRALVATPGQRVTGPPAALGRVAARSWGAPADTAIRSQAALESPAAMRAVPSASGAPGDTKFSPPPDSSSLARLLEWLPRSVELDAPRLRHWIELLGFARPATTDGAKLPELLDWLRQLQAADAPRRAPAAAAESRRAAAPGGGGSSSASTDDRSALPGSGRENFRLAEQALTHNLLQRATVGLQQETQQPLNLSLSLPFLDGAEVRPLRLELEQRGRRGEAGGDSSWEVRVSFEFGALGPITCHLVLTGSALAASFYCEREATRDTVASALPDLRRQLDAAGFDPGELSSFVGRARAPQATAAIVAEFLIDLEA